MCRMFSNGKMMEVLAILLVLFMTVGVAENERTDVGSRA